MSELDQGDIEIDLGFTRLIVTGHFQERLSERFGERGDFSDLVEILPGCLVIPSWKDPRQIRLLHKESRTLIVLKDRRVLKTIYEAGSSESSWVEHWLDRTPIRERLTFEQWCRNFNERKK